MRWDAIYKRIKDIPEPAGVEIGVYQGELSENILRLHPRLRLFMVDPWSLNAYDGKGDESATAPYREKYTKEAESNYSKTVERTKEFESRIMIMRCTSLQAVLKFTDGMFDFVFLDGDHSYDAMCDDIASWHRLVKPGGWISGHDYCIFEGVTKAVDELYGNSIELDEDFTWFVRKV